MSPSQPDRSVELSQLPKVIDFEGLDAHLGRSRQSWMLEVQTDPIGFQTIQNRGGFDSPPSVWAEFEADRAREDPRQPKKSDSGRGANLTPPIREGAAGNQVLYGGK